MKFKTGKPAIAAGALLMVVSLLVVSLAAPATTLGQETDVPADPPASIPGDGIGTDTGAGGVGPDQLPDAGIGPSGGTGSTALLFAGTLAAAGLTLAGAGIYAGRKERRVEVRS